MDVKQLLAEIDNRKAKLSAFRPLTEGETERLRDEFIIGFTYNSNAIEGNTMTLYETAMVLREGITIDGKSLKEHMELIGHKDACMFVEDLVQEAMPLTEKNILDLHSLVLMDRREDRGVYRRVPVTITGMQVELPQPWAVPVAIEQLLVDYHSEKQNLHSLERAALFHLRFETIHPFIDGNGRTGRLIMNLELMIERLSAHRCKISRSCAVYRLLRGVEFSKRCGYDY
ncbi:MAG: Fic family protein [Peptococcaceae bacterium]|nr:Fic family protein [Peptococcaceae bacterium]